MDKVQFEVFATGAFPIEDVRKASWKNGLRLQRSQFGQMFRNPVYAGKLYVPETTNEEGHLVKGVHEAIVSEELFLKVQRILNKRTETNSCLRTREKLRDELPLRGHLTCPECGRCCIIQQSNKSLGIKQLTTTESTEHAEKRDKTARFAPL